LRAEHIVAPYLAGAGYLTGYLALTEFAKFKPGQAVLAPAIGSAVGMETIQVARRLGASLTISTASTTQMAEQALAAGCERVIDLSQESMKTACCASLTEKVSTLSWMA
jgi:NADPH:quinone reductase-like Zn-dependent oxidoreductase